MKFSVEKINDIIASLDYVIPAQPKLRQEGELTAQEAFLLMAPKLNEQIDKGATIKELTEFLQAMDFPVKGAALRRFLNGYLTVQQKVQQARETKASTGKKSRKKGAIKSSDPVPRNISSVPEAPSKTSSNDSPLISEE